MHVVILSGVMEGLWMSEKPAFPNVEREKKNKLFAFLSSGSHLHRKNLALAMSSTVHSHHPHRGLPGMKECTSFAKEQSVLVVLDLTLGAVLSC